MVWFFTRNRERMQMDTFYDNNTAEFVLRLSDSGGIRSVERFRTIAHFREGIESVERRLSADRWTQDGGPIVIPDGFPRRRLS
jgi:hypothetical protein